MAGLGRDFLLSSELGRRRWALAWIRWRHPQQDFAVADRLGASSSLGNRDNAEDLLVDGGLGAPGRRGGLLIGCGRGAQSTFPCRLKNHTPIRML
jgi:hypothetical protein